MSSNKLLKNTIYYIISGIMLQCMNFITLPIFTRMLSLKSFGIVSIYNTWLNMFMIFICLQSYGSIGNAYIKYKKDEFEEYISSVLLLIIYMFCFWIVLFFILKQDILKILNISESLVWILMIQSFFNVIILLKTTVYKYEQNAEKKIIVSMINVILNIVCSIILIKYVFKEKDYYGRIIGGSFPSILLGSYFIIDIFKHKKPKMNKQYWKYCLGLTIPIVFHGISQLILGSSDRIMLEKVKGFIAAGEYSFIYDFGYLVSMVWGALNSAWVPWYYENMKERKEVLIKRYSKIYLNIYTIFCIIFINFSPEVIKILSPSKYWNSIDILPIIVFGCYLNFLYSFSINYEFYINETKYIASGTILAACINIILNLYYIPKFGKSGAAFTTVISYLLIFLYHEILVRKRFKYKNIRIKEYIKNIIIFIIYIFVYNQCVNSFFQRGVLLLAIVSILYLSNDDLKNIIKINLKRRKIW